MLDLFSYLLLAFAFLVAIPVLILSGEIVAAVTTTSRESWNSSGGLSGPIAVLVPAHNEVAGINATLDDVKKQLQSGDRLLVVADNCSDGTETVAMAAGAEVTQRHDLDKIGKGYALDWGVRCLRENPPAVVIILDADCRLLSETLRRLACACEATGRPIQALNLMNAPEESPIDYKVAMFAFRVKNWVRPLGLQAFNLPCQLMGTGMAFPWEVINTTNLATGSEVEDLKLGLELARNGKSPLFCPSGGVLSRFPLSIEGAKTQRKRWERGHIGVIANVLPSFLFEAIVQRNISLLALVLDAAVPPLTLLGVLVCSILSLTALGFLCGLSSLALKVSAVAFASFAFAVFLGWLKFGRDVLPLRSAVSVVPYIIRKLALYWQVLFRQRAASQWVRTARDTSDRISTKHDQG